MLLIRPIQTPWLHDRTSPTPSLPCVSSWPSRSKHTGWQSSASSATYRAHVNTSWYTAWDSAKQQPLHGYSDSDWGNDPNDRRSITGWVFLLHHGAVSWQSCKQPTVALSSVEAEYMASTQATREAVWWRAFLTELGLPPTSATTIHSDSQGAIALDKNPEHHKRTKHIDIQHHYVREQVTAGTVVLPYISTKDMVADILTKPLAAEQHIKLAGQMGVRANTQQAHSSVFIITPVCLEPYCDRHGTTQRLPKSPSWTILSPPFHSLVSHRDVGPSTPVVTVSPSDFLPARRSDSTRAPAERVYPLSITIALPRCTATAIELSNIRLI